MEREATREGALDLACAVLGLEPRPRLVERAREALAHPQAGTDAHTFRTRYDDGAAIELVQSVSHGVGNPRDGWGYDMSWALRVGEPQAARLVVKVNESDWAPKPKFFHATVTGEGLDLAALDRARAALRERFGAASDHCDHLWMAVSNTERFLAAGDEDGARRLIARACGWDERGAQVWRERVADLCARLGVPLPRGSGPTVDDETFDDF